MPKPRIAILTLPESTASVVYGMYDMFRSAGRDWGYLVDGRPAEPSLDPMIVANASGPFVLANEVPITPHCGIASEVIYDVVCVPELSISPCASIAGRFQAEVAWLRRQYAAGALLTTACSGAVLLAEAGLLDDCDATTHWAYCDALQAQYPKLRVLKERALVVSGPGQRLVMAGGGTSWLDLALYVVAQVVSLESAMQLARLHLVDWHESGQQPFARLARTRQGDDREIGTCQEWIAKHYAVSAPVASMLRISELPERTFKRRFKAATGMAPLEYVHTLRLEQAKHLLESTDHSVERVALDVGYEDAAFFARLFRRAVQLSPAQYRRKFGSLRRALGSSAGSPRVAARANQG
jgi:transcriptional regulator GlxA family with amidase domain